MLPKKLRRNDNTVVLRQNIDIQFVGAGEMPNPENSRYPNKLTMISFAIRQTSPRFYPQFAGFALLHVERTEHQNGVSFSLSVEGSFGFDIHHQTELAAQFVHRLRPDHQLVGLGIYESIARIKECANIHSKEDFSALLSALRNLDQRGKIMDIGEALHRPDFKIEDAITLVGNAVRLNQFDEILAWSEECEHGIAQFMIQRNRLLWFLLVTYMLRPVEHEAALIALSMR